MMVYFTLNNYLYHIGQGKDFVFLEWAKTYF
jgi:hypothetical protein